MSNTSSEVKRRYNNKTYKGYYAQIHIPLMEEIEKQLKEKGWSKAEFIRQSAQEVLGINIDEYIPKSE